MPKPEIIGSMRSSYTRAVCMVCIEKNIEYVLTECLLGSRELFAIHPFGKMPVLRHGDFELYESKAIATGANYLVGGQLTFADLNLLTILHNVRLLPGAADALAEAVHLARYLDRHSIRPSYTKTIPPPGPPRRTSPR